MTLPPAPDDDTDDTRSPLLIYGGSGQSFAAAQGVLDDAPGEYRIAAFVDDFAPDGATRYGDIPVRRPEAIPDLVATVPFLIAVGRPSARRALAEKVPALGGRFANLYTRPRPGLTHVTVGEGTMLSARSYFGPMTRIGAHAMVLTMCSIGHDVVIGDFSVVCPSATISGYVTLEEETFIGAGAIVVEGRAERPLTIGRGAYVAAGAVVTKSVPAGARVAGNPARPLREFVRSLRT